MADIKEYISYKKYDSLAWVPTIRGALSLEIVEDAKYIFGDVDKYIVPIKSYIGLKSQYHIAATALLTFNDSKSGPEYCRTFRYIFCGQIDTKEHHVLNGRLCILAEEKEELSKNEADLLGDFIHLTKLKKEYEDLAKIEAASMENLAKKRNAMIEDWKSINNRMSEIENDEESPRKNFCFNVALFRDGLLLLEYDKQSKYTSYILEKGGGENDESDFTQHLPLHRVFKVAMNIIKFLFHSNYHHNAEHDTLLPASNLHPLMKAKDDAERKICFTSIFHHQLDSLLTPITKMKRKKYAEYTINPRGLFLYANSLINVFGKNGLIDSDEESRSLRFLEAQRQEYEFMTEKNTQRAKAFISLVNPWTLYFNFLPFLGVAFAALGCIFAPEKLKEFIDEKSLNYFSIICIGILIALSVFSLLFFIIHNISKLFWKTHHFIYKEENHRFYFANSNLETKKFSCRYSLWIRRNNNKKSTNDKGYYLIRIAVVFLYIAVIALIIFAIIYIIRLYGAEILNQFQLFWE